MPWHTVAWRGSVGTTADTDIAAVSDPIISIQNNHFILSAARQLMWARAGSATLTRARLASPTMRQIANPYIRPVEGTLLPGSNPSIWHLEEAPFTVPPFEEIQFLATSGIAMGTEVVNCHAALYSSYQAWPQGQIIPLRWTATTAAVAGAWTQLSITFQDTIPSGLYTLVLSEHFSTNAVCHRVILSNQLDRPGILSFSATTKRLPDAWQLGALGVMGQFRSNDLPRIEVMCESTDNSHEGYLHVMRTGSF